MNGTPDGDETQSGRHKVETIPARSGDYRPFGRWLDGELEKLVKRWIHLAAPARGHQRKAFRRRGRQSERRKPGKGRDDSK